MLKEQIQTIIKNNESLGWVLEPDAKAIMKAAGLDTPSSVLTDDLSEAVDFLSQADRPVVAKAVSKRIIHKTEFNAVVTGIETKASLSKHFERLLTLDGCESVLVEEMIQGIELIVGGKNDYQFGPVVIFGLGGTAVEIYNDTAIRMAPIREQDVSYMVDSLIGKGLITGYRGQQGVHMKTLTQLLVDFSHLLTDLEPCLDSIDLNPVICTSDRCVIADARIILKD